jgi:hypothetical protein
MIALHWKVISFATAAVLLLIRRGLSPGENSTANRVAAPPAKSLLKLLWKHRTTGEGMCEIEQPQMG